MSGFDKIVTKNHKVAPGLSREEALRRVVKKKPSDFRGFTYDKKTGKATTT